MKPSNTCSPPRLPALTVAVALLVAYLVSLFVSTGDVLGSPEYSTAGSILALDSSASLESLGRRLRVWEGVAPSEACPENDYTLLSQAQVDAFPSDCTEINGDLTVGLSLDITDLSPMAAVTTVGGNLRIVFNYGLTSLGGLDALTSVGQELRIDGNHALTQINGFPNLAKVNRLVIYNNSKTRVINGFGLLTSVEDLLDIKSNDSLISIEGFGGLSVANGAIRIVDNPVLTMTPGLSGLTQAGSLSIKTNASLRGIDEFSGLVAVVDEIQISDNDALENLDGLSALTHVGSHLIIDRNGTLTHIDGLSALASVGGNLVISDNDALTNLAGLASLTSVDGGVSIRGRSLDNLDGLGALTVVGGTLRIAGGTSVTHLGGLSALKSVGSLIISGAALVSLKGLSALTTIRETLSISYNLKLTNLNGLEGISALTYLEISHNPFLQDVIGLRGLRTVTESITIEDNNALRDIQPLGGLSGPIRYVLDISDNDSLGALDGLGGITSVGGYLTIAGNDALEDLSGLGSIATVGAGLTIVRNENLWSLNGLSSLTAVGTPDSVHYLPFRRVSIGGNPALTNLDGLSGLKLIVGDLGVLENPQLSFCSCGLNECTRTGCVTGDLTLSGNDPDGDCNRDGLDLIPDACPSPIPLPVPPELVSPTDVSIDVPNAIDLVFRPVDGANRYNVQVSDDPDGAPVLFSSNVPHGPVRFEAPTPGQTYYWRAQAENKGYRSPFSDWWSFTTMRPRPDVPALIEPANGADSVNASVVLRWLAAENAERYDVQVSTSADFSDIVYKENTPGLSTTFVAPRTMQTYFWRAQAFGPGGASAGFSPVWSFSVGSEGSLVVRNLDPADGARGVPVDPLLSWTEPQESAAQHYHVQLAADTTFETLVVDRDSVVGMSLAVTDLEHDTDYCWRVAGVDEDIRFTFTPPACFTTIIAAPDMVTLFAPDNGATEVAAYTTFSWQPLDGVAAYHLQVASDATLTSLVIDDSTLTATTFIISAPLTYSAGYYWRVRAALDDGLGKTTGLLFGPWSETRSFTIAVGTATEDEPGIPTAFALHPAYPNPFNPSTTIRYDVPEVATVRLTVFDGLGRRIEELGTRHSAPGTYSVTWNASTHPSGMYFVRMTADSYDASQRLFLIR